MPMLKTVTTPNGVDCTFHKATSGEYSFRDGVVVIRVGSWVDEAKYLAGYGVVYVVPVTLPIAAAADVEAAMVVDADCAFFMAQLVDDPVPPAPIVIAPEQDPSA